MTMLAAEVARTPGFCSSLALALSRVSASSRLRSRVNFSKSCAVLNVFVVDGAKECRHQGHSTQGPSQAGRPAGESAWSSGRNGVSTVRRRTPGACWQ